MKEELTSQVHKQFGHYVIFIGLDPVFHHSRSNFIPECPMTATTTSTRVFSGIVSILLQDHPQIVMKYAK
jgi:hypothetical protein